MASPHRPSRGASIHPRTRADGTIAYRLHYRLDGAQKVLTFDDPEIAEQWRQRFARDPKLALAMLTAAQAQASGAVDDVLTVERMVTQHIAGRAATDPLFATQRSGKAVRHSNFYHRIWTPTLDRLAVAEVDEDGGVVRRAWEVRPRPHDLRHTYASWALQAGVPLIELQRQMGHESITTTADRYGHLAPGAGAATAAAIGSRLSAALRGVGHLRGLQGGKGGEVEAEAAG